MIPSDQPTAIKKSVVVHCARDAAFRTWSEQIDLWWPKGHSRSGSMHTAVFLEGFVGGRLYERTPEGSEYVWGHVFVWAPPQHLAYHWYLGSGPARPTRVDVRFFAEAPERTRVEVLHQGAELLGASWGRTSQIFDSAWEHVLAAFAAALSAST